MSRILRRPMFRGGRVDARGTGIASGLGYAGGGSVQNRPGYDTGGTLTDPQAVIEARRLGILKTPTWLDETFRKKYYLDEDVAYQGIPITGMQGMIEAEAGVDLEGNPTIDEGGILDETRNLILKGDKKGTAEDYTQFFKEKFDKNYETEIDEQKKGLEAAGELEKLALFGDDQKVPEEGETREQFEERIRRENAEELQTLIESQMSKGTPEEEIEKNKKIFQKAYGSGVADDASSMLLNFAGKALKPEATVKSAFGEFFEAEGKRPSERKKYKDAATTAAINAYLTGEKTIAETEAFMNRTDYTNAQKLAIVEKAQRGWSMNDFVLNRDKGETKSEALEGGARKKVDFGQYKDFKKIKSKQNDEKLLIEESVGIIFLDEGTREVFTIIIGEDGTPAKQILYGV
jgi:hypothetical protein